MGLTRFCLRNPVAGTLFYALVGTAGLLAIFRMGRSILPPLQFPVVTIAAPYAGAGAPDIERLVIEPIEDQVDALPALDRVSASAQDGIAQIVVRFRFGSDLEAARNGVQRAVDAAAQNLPRDLVPPLVSRDDRGAAPVLEEAVSSAVLTPGALSQLVDRTIVPALRATPGTGGVFTSGELTRQFTVEPLSGPLDALGATVLDLYQALQGSNVVLPGGQLTNPVQQTPIGIRSTVLSAGDIENFPFVPRGPAAAAQAESASVRVREVARVTDGYADQQVVVRVDALPSIVLSVSSAPGVDAVRAIAASNRTLARLVKALPLVRFEQLRTDRPATETAVAGVMQTLGEGIALTVLAMLVFLHAWRNALIAAVAIPASLGAAFATMWAAGFTMNVLSLMGLSLTIGILVDDSIVIIEAIAHHAQQGLSGDAAALAGRGELGAAAFAITLVDVAVFAPIALMSGLVGEFMREFGLVIVIATSFSLLVSLTLTPLLAARWALHRGRPWYDELTFTMLLAHLTSHAGALPWTLRSKPVLRVAAAWHAGLNGFNAAEARLSRVYAGRWLPRAWELRRIVAVATVLLCAVSLAPVVTGAIPSEFSPPVERGAVAVDLTFPPGTTLEHADAATRRIAGRLLDDDDVRHVITSAGRSFDGTSDVYAANRAQITAVLTDPTGSGADVLDRLRAMTTVAPDAAFAGTGTGMGGRPAVSYNLTGDTGGVALAARRIRSALEANPFAQDVRVSDAGFGPHVDIAVDPAKALLLDVVPDDAAQTARIATGGSIATKARLPSGLVNVVVRSGAAGRGDLDALERVSVRSADGRIVPLRAVATFTNRRGPTIIDRENGERITTVSANTRDGVPIGLVTTSLAAQLRSPGFLPPGVSLAARGDLEQFLDAVARIGAALLLSVVAIYMTLAILYRSYMLPFVIMATVPLASIGAFGTLFAINSLRGIFPAAEFLRGQTLNLYSMLGIVMLVGLVAKNGILLVEYAERGVRAGAAPFAAMAAAAERRFRPILMTTLAMVAGMLPLALGEAIGAQYRRALGTVVIGGLSSSLFLTLFIVPLAYVALRRPQGAGVRRGGPGARLRAAE